MAVTRDFDIEDRFSEDSDDPDAPELPLGIKKQCVKAAPPAHTERPRIGDEVSVHFVAKLSDGTQIGSTRDGGKQFVFVLGQQPREVILGMELAVQTMKRGEVSRFVICSKFAYEDLGSPPLVPPDATLRFEIELASWVSKYDLFGDGRAVKTVQRRGSGESSPKSGQDVLMSLKAIARNGKVLDDYVSMEYTIGRPAFGVIFRIVNEALTHMVEGEEATLCLRRFHVKDTLVDRRYGGSTVEIALLRVFDTEDVSPLRDGSLVKKLLVKGAGDTQPQEASRVQLLVDSATDGTEALSGFCAPRLFEFTTGNGEVCDALEFAVPSMRLGERAALTCRQPGRFCEPLLGPGGLEAQHVVLTLELQAVSNPDDLADSPTEDRLAFATARKSLAADLFKRQRFALALGRYDGILALLPPPGGAAAVRELRHVCELNRAACLLRLGDPAGAKAACDTVLGGDPSDAKALYRRASAHFDLSEYSDALRDLSKLLRQSPGNTEARGLHARVKEAQRQYGKDAKTAAALMIQGQAPQGATDAGETAPTDAGPSAPRRAAGLQLLAKACARLPCCPGL